MMLEANPKLLKLFSKSSRLKKQNKKQKPKVQKYDFSSSNIKKKSCSNFFVITNIKFKFTFILFLFFYIIIIKHTQRTSDETLPTALKEGPLNK